MSKWIRTNSWKYGKELWIGRLLFSYAWDIPVENRQRAFAVMEVLEGVKTIILLELAIGKLQFAIIWEMT